MINISVVYINLNEYERRNGYNILFTRDFKIVWTIYYKIYRIIELLYFQNAHYFIILGFIRLCYNLGVAKIGLLQSAYKVPRCARTANRFFYRTMREQGFNNDLVYFFRLLLTRLFSDLPL